jgi:hypothetical protein
VKELRFWLVKGKFYEANIAAIIAIIVEMIMRRVMAIMYLEAAITMFIIIMGYYCC